MNKHHHFWLDRWHNNDIPFHQQAVNPDLPQYWPQLDLKKGSRVLVPLCGKSLDMIWLQQQGHSIIGIELSTVAIEQFFSLIPSPYHIEQHGVFQVYKNEHYEIWAGDLFQLDKHHHLSVDAIYDRGSLIALPHKIRNLYVPQVLRWLNKEGKILLKTVTYKQEEMQGPPYSVPEQEVISLYHHCSKIQKIKSVDRQPENMQNYLARGCKALSDETWIITK
ncbi:thiopurine S-methyltransferase [Legionella sp. W05-934-2]|uniref:thiopurine S-methyltransferase n=1 Tax=Legionella sp. W05-934-2 TaxID=1198649 RepID=UPI0034635371